jgi:hypothetical protein
LALSSQARAAKAQKKQDALDAPASSMPVAASSTAAAAAAGAAAAVGGTGPGAMAVAVAAGSAAASSMAPSARGTAASKKNNAGLHFENQCNRRVCRPSHHQSRENSGLSSQHNTVEDGRIWMNK